MIKPQTSCTQDESSIQYTNRGFAQKSDCLSKILQLLMSIQFWPVFIFLFGFISTVFDTHVVNMYNLNNLTILTWDASRGELSWSSWPGHRIRGAPSSATFEVSKPMDISLIFITKNIPIINHLLCETVPSYIFLILNVLLTKLLSKNTYNKIQINVYSSLATVQ